MKKENKSFFVHVLGGVAAGYLAFLLADPMRAFMGIIVLLAVLIKTMDLVLGKEKMGWWLKNGTAVYILFSIVTWTIFYNL